MGYAMADFTLTAGDDLFPGVGIDTSGNDAVSGEGGNDSISAGAGDDVLYGGLGDDTLRGGTGNDVLSGGELVYAGVGDDTIEAAEGAVIFAEAGNDRIETTGALNTTVWAGIGDDTVRVDVLQSDTAGLNILHGQGGIDELSIGVYPDSMAETGIVDITLSLTAGIWRINVDGERVVVADGFENLSWFSTSTNLNLQSSGGDDFIGYQALNATIDAGAGNDLVVIDRYETGASYTIDGGVGDDMLVAYFVDATSGVDMDARGATLALTVGGVSLGAISGFESYDIHGSAFGDVIYLGAGNDTINGDSGGQGRDTIGGGAGDDRIYGGAQADIVTGGVGNDAVYGGLGNDTITGGVGRDWLAGGIGRDVFDFNSIGDSGKSLNAKFIDNIAFFEMVSDVTSDAFRDRIDLSTIDAQAATIGNQAFSYIGSAAFTAEGQVRFAQTGADTLIEINTAGTGDAEMRIYVVGLTGALLGAEDFIL